MGQPVPTHGTSSHVAMQIDGCEDESTSSSLLVVVDVSKLHGVSCVGFHWCCRMSVAR